MSHHAQFRIDGHKLHLHPQRVADWLDGKNIAPIYMEISPAGACNHRCCFCALDFMQYRPSFLPAEIMHDRFTEMGKAGVKAVMFAGEGEPFLHKEMAILTESAKGAGIDVAFTTNASQLKPETARRILPLTSWIKVSCNAGTEQTYGQVHGTKPEDFEKVMRNMEEAVRLRQLEGSGCTLGFQMVILPENMHEAEMLARRVREIGADYLVFKPYSQHPQSHKTGYNALGFDAETQEKLEALCTDSFKIIYRQQAAIRGAQSQKSYDRCLALPFWSYLDATGQLWGCSMFLGNDKLAYGSLLEHSFAELWNGEKRLQSMRWCKEQLDASRCRINCRMDPINGYLWDLTHPGPHSNFV